MEIRYFVCALGYDSNGCITDFEKDFGDFDTIEKAQNKFDEVIDRAKEIFLDGDYTEVAYWHLQLEECECTKEYDECIDIIDEYDVEKYNNK